MECPFDYSPCCQTVTIYRQTPEGVIRKVCNRAYYVYTDKMSMTPWETIPNRKFHLILAGAEDVCCEDRIYPGVGPEQVDWDNFVPATVPGLSIAANVCRHQWFGKICHVEVHR